MRQRGNAFVVDARGFSMLEILLVVAILGTMAAMVMMVSPAFARFARAEAGLMQAVNAFKAAREVAISQRRNVEIRFIGNNAIQTARVNIDGTTTVLRTMQLENNVEFQLESGVPDTPDLFGNANAISFGPSATRMFTSEGSFVDSNGDVLNGTLFMSIPGQPNSARAISVFGATALIRTWSWTGQGWTE